MSRITDNKRLVYGVESAGSVMDILNDAGSTMPIIVTTPSYSHSNFYHRFIDSLTTDYQEFREITVGPPLPEVEHLAETYRNKGCDSIVSLGNSSVIWASKLLKYYFAHEATHITIPSTLTVATFSEWAEYRMGNEVNYVLGGSLEPDAVILDPMAGIEVDEDIWHSSGIGILDYNLSNLMRDNLDRDTEGLLLSTTESIIINLTGKSMDSRLECLLSTWQSKVDNYSVRDDPMTETRQFIKEALDIPDELSSVIALPITAHACLRGNPERMARLASHLGFKGSDPGDLSEKSFESVSGLLGKLDLPRILEKYSVERSVLLETISHISRSPEATDQIFSSLYGSS